MDDGCQYHHDSRKCPFCNKNLSLYTKEYIRKHVARCEQKLNPYQYSDRKRGRPRQKSRCLSMRPLREGHIGSKRYTGP